MPINNWIQREGLALLTDLYQITMAGGYFKTNRHTLPVVFEYFFRSLPTHTGFAVFAGAAQLKNYINNLKFEKDDIEYLRSFKLFDETFLKYLSEFKFNGHIMTVEEGTLVFPHEPLVIVKGGLLECQLIESFVMNCLNYPTLVAAKAARLCLAAEKDSVVEFGLRRAQGPDGSLCGSRAAFIGGCHATSNVLAGKLFNIPVKGTMAHSWVMSFDSELESFRKYAEIYPDNVVLLIDTYDTVKSGIPNAVKVFQELKVKNPNIRPAIRIDSGDLSKLSKIAFNEFEKAGFKDPIIMASGDLDEELIADMKRQGAKINVWGVGTNLITCAPIPALGGVYKLVAAYENKVWIPKIKVSSNPIKTTNPCEKRIVRFSLADKFVGDVLIIAGDNEKIILPENSKYIGYDPITGKKVVIEYDDYHYLLTHIKTISDSATVGKEKLVAEIKKLPDECLRLKNPHVYPVLLSERLYNLKQEMLEKISEHA